MKIVENSYSYDTTHLTVIITRQLHETFVSLV